MSTTAVQSGIILIASFVLVLNVITFYVFMKVHKRCGIHIALMHLSVSSILCLLIEDASVLKGLCHTLVISR